MTQKLLYRASLGLTRDGWRLQVAAAPIATETAKLYKLGGSLGFRSQFRKDEVLQVDTGMFRNSHDRIMYSTIFDDEALLGEAVGLLYAMVKKEFDEVAEAFREMEAAEPLFTGEATEEQIETALGNARRNMGEERRSTIGPLVLS